MTLGSDVCPKKRPADTDVCPKNGLVDTDVCPKKGPADIDVCPKNHIISHNGLRTIFVIIA